MLLWSYRSEIEENTILGIRHKLSFDLSQMSPDELREIIRKAEQLLEIRRFEDGLQKAVTEYRRRDPNVIHL